MSNIIKIGGARVHCPICETDWTDSERIGFVPVNSPARKGFEIELLNDPNKRYWVCPKCGNLIDRLDQERGKEKKEGESKPEQEGEQEDAG